MEQGMMGRIAALAMAGLASCAAPQVAVRPAGQALPASAGSAEGDHQLAMGNIGLAIEAYGKALRANPADVAALAGSAAAYDRMGRFDLSRKRYEQALAIAPGDQRLYQALAGSLAMQGQYEAAAGVRREGLARLAAAAPAAAAPAREIRSIPAPPATLPRSSPELGDVAVLAVLTPTGSVARLPLAEAAIEADAPPVALAAVPARRPADPAPAPGARLIRLSPQEVVLATGPGPRWTPRRVAATAQSTTIRFDPVRRETPRLVLLNAARVDGLAAGTRAYLQQRGFAQIRIGNAPARRSQSVVLYSAGMRGAAMRLAGQFGFTVRPLQQGEAQQMTVLLGLDAARNRALAQARLSRRG